jgi:hypothetical protein
LKDGPIIEQDDGVLYAVDRGSATGREADFAESVQR